MMGIELTVRPYQRRFIKPFYTAHGLWIWREGLLIRLRDSLGRVGYGEVAPIPWFGSEAVEQAQAFCAAQGGGWRSEPVPDGLPATQFGFGCALEDLYRKEGQGDAAIAGQEPAIADLCGLLPAGQAALGIVSQRLSQGYSTLKWKIGVFPFEQEMLWLQALWAQLPPATQLRLDANGGLDLAQTEQWLAVCDGINQRARSATIEHLEQPLPPDQVETMAELGQRYRTAIALDESVATLVQLETCWAQGWRGVVVVKPAIAGPPQRLQAFCLAHRPRLVFSSVFETPVGRRAALALAGRCACAPTLAPGPALGFGTQGCFDDDWDTLTPPELWNQV